MRDEKKEKEMIERGGGDLFCKHYHYRKKYYVYERRYGEDIVDELELWDGSYFFFLLIFLS